MPKKLRLLGKVLHVLEEKEVIVKLDTKEFTPRKGTRVLLKNMAWLGNTTNIFGPVSSPYVGVIPHKAFKALDSLRHGEPLFVMGEEKPNKKKDPARNKKSTTSFNKKKNKSFKKNKNLKSKKR